jgi:hypothetical protein
LNACGVDVERWELIECGQSILDRAIGVIEATGAKTLDALHIASALVFQELYHMRVGFVTADRTQMEAARQMTLRATRLEVT